MLVEVGAEERVEASLALEVLDSVPVLEELGNRLPALGVPAEGPRVPNRRQETRRLTELLVVRAEVDGQVDDREVLTHEGVEDALRIGEDVVLAGVLLDDGVHRSVRREVVILKADEENGRAARMSHGGELEGGAAV